MYVYTNLAREKVEQLLTLHKVSNEQIRAYLRTKYIAHAAHPSLGYLRPLVITQSEPVRGGTYVSVRYRDIPPSLHQALMNDERIRAVDPELIEKSFALVLRGLKVIQRQHKWAHKDLTGFEVPIVSAAGSNRLNKLLKARQHRVARFGQHSLGVFNGREVVLLTNRAAVAVVGEKLRNCVRSIYVEPDGVYTSSYKNSYFLAFRDPENTESWSSLALLGITSWVIDSHHKIQINPNPKVPAFTIDEHRGIENSAVPESDEQALQKVESEPAIQILMHRIIMDTQIQRSKSRDLTGGQVSPFWERLLHHQRQLTAQFLGYPNLGFWMPEEVRIDSHSDALDRLIRFRTAPSEGASTRTEGHLEVQRGATRGLSDAQRRVGAQQQARARQLQNMPRWLRPAVPEAPSPQQVPQEARVTVRPPRFDRIEFPESVRNALVQGGFRRGEIPALGALSAEGRILRPAQNNPADVATQQQIIQGDNHVQ